LDSLFEQSLEMNVYLTTSTITLLEVLVKPLKTNNFDLVEKYKTLLCQSDTFEICDLDVEIAGKAAELRAKYQLKNPDAIQVATAICRFADYFLTNDKQLKIVSELSVLILDELVAL
jgi:predicted nucleic acid-binding protein